MADWNTLKKSNENRGSSSAGMPDASLQADKELNPLDQPRSSPLDSTVNRSYLDMYFEDNEDIETDEEPSNLCGFEDPMTRGFTFSFPKFIF